MRKHLKLRKHTSRFFFYNSFVICTKSEQFIPWDILFLFKNPFSLLENALLFSCDTNENRLRAGVWIDELPFPQTGLQSVGPPRGKYLRGATSQPRPLHDQAYSPRGFPPPYYFSKTKILSTLFCATKTTLNGQKWSQLLGVNRRMPRGGKMERTFHLLGLPQQ